MLDCLIAFELTPNAGMQPLELGSAGRRQSGGASPPDEALRTSPTPRTGIRRAARIFRIR
mgnify:CR=1 FL=1